jgi:hypothetical protein
MKTLLATSAFAIALIIAPSVGASGRDIDCKLDYQLTSWSLVYKHAAGRGMVRCDNGQALPVRITAQGLGLTAGKWKIDNGKGRFTDVHDIREVYGNYAHAGASAGMVKSAETQLLSKGNVSLALAGGGEGINLGVEVGAFHIKPIR